MSLVGKHVRRGVRTADGLNAIEYIYIAEELYEKDGTRLYRCQVMMEHKGWHRVVNADQYDMMFTPNTAMKPNRDRKYKGENPHREIRNLQAAS